MRSYFVYAAKQRLSRLNNVKGGRIHFLFRLHRYLDTWPKEFLASSPKCSNGVTCMTDTTKSKCSCSTPRDARAVAPLPDHLPPFTTVILNLCCQTLANVFTSRGRNERPTPPPLLQINSGNQTPLKRHL